MFYTSKEELAKAKKNESEMPRGRRDCPRL